MKGIVFTEFMDMVADVFSEDVLDDVIDKSALPNDGAYTAVGTYSHKEMVTMVVHLSKEVNMPVDDLIQAFGKHLFQRFTELYPHFFADATDAFDFFTKIDNYIHVEVLKLYPDAELPKFSHEQITDKELRLTYQSPRPFSQLALGLINACIGHFGQSAEVSLQDNSTDETSDVTFTIVLH